MGLRGKFSQGKDDKTKDRDDTDSEEEDTSNTKTKTTSTPKRIEDTNNGERPRSQGQTTAQILLGSPFKPVRPEFKR